MIKLHCQVCGSEYFRVPSAAKGSKHCSRVCHNKIAGQVSSKPWAHKIAKARTGMKAPWNAERNRKYRYAGEKSGNWKGNDVGYIALHQWIKRSFEWANMCDLCYSNENLELANKTGEYKREKEDWWILCRKCHRARDAEFRRNGGVTRKPHKWKKKNPA